MMPRPEEPIKPFVGVDAKRATSSTARKATCPREFLPIPPLSRSPQVPPNLHLSRTSYHVEPIEDQEVPNAWLCEQACSL